LLDLENNYNYWEANIGLMSKNVGKRKANRLIHEKSPYLIQHAYNPVNWYPWVKKLLKKQRVKISPFFSLSDIPHAIGVM